MTDRTRIILLSTLIPLLIPLTITGILAVVSPANLHGLWSMWLGWLIGTTIAGTSLWFSDRE